jgi:hypothetical protein
LISVNKRKEKWEGVEEEKEGWKRRMEGKGRGRGEEEGKGTQTRPIRFIDFKRIDTPGVTKIITSYACPVPI